MAWKIEVSDNFTDQADLVQGIRDLGIDEIDLPSAHELGVMLVERLLEERPVGLTRAGNPRVGVMLNGLGAVKYEELFVLYKSVAAELENAGLTVINPEVGELVTSFEMAGVSLTLFWLDDDMEAVWTARARTPAYNRFDRPISGTPRKRRDRIQSTILSGGRQRHCAAARYTPSQRPSLRRPLPLPRTRKPRRGRRARSPSSCRSRRCRNPKIYYDSDHSHR